MRGEPGLARGPPAQRRCTPIYMPIQPASSSSWHNLHNLLVYIKRYASLHHPYPCHRHGDNVEVNPAQSNPTQSILPRAVRPQSNHGVVPGEHGGVGQVPSEHIQGRAHRAVHLRRGEGECLLVCGWERMW